MYEEQIPGVGRCALTPVDPTVHAGLLHGWVTQPRARFWGMGDHSVEEVREVYAFLHDLPTHHAYLILLDGAPVGLFQTYQPAADPVGERYPVRPGDVGMHLLLAPPEGAPRGLAAAVGPTLVRFLFQDPTRDRVVVEPDVRNGLALRRLEASGFTFGDEIDLPDKRARLAFLTRDRFAARYRVPSPS